MKLESQITSLEISKRLKELGVKQESLFWWNEGDSPAGGSTFQLEDSKYPDLIAYEDYECISAFTVAELGEMLPNMVEGRILSCDKVEENLYEVYYEGSKFDSCYIQKSNTEADARGKCLIYLIENSLIKL